MESLYQHTDYRTFLKEWFDGRKREGSPLSYRGLGRKVGIDPGFLVHILQGSKHTAEASIPQWVAVLGLDAGQAAYFRELVLFTRARAAREISDRFQRLCQLRDMALGEVQERQYRYYLDWRVPAIRVLLYTFPFRGDHADLARRLDPAITPDQAREAVDLLLELGLVSWTPEGVLEPITPFLTSGNRWKEHAARAFQDQTLELARRSLQVHPATRREVSTLTLAIPASELVTLQEMVRAFRQSVLQWTAGLDSSDTVVQVNIAAFPLSITAAEDQP